MPGIFTISLDFELHWGVFDKKDRGEELYRYQHTLKVVPRMLDLFAQYDVHVSWATVGSMFAKDREEWLAFKPCNEPDYENTRFNVYRWIEKHGLPKEMNVAHFAAAEIERILQYPGQELASHTFSHYYCLEAQKAPEAFIDDLKASVKAAEKYTVNLRSLVFPRNQFNSHFLKACYQQGIRVVRSNPHNWYWAKSRNPKLDILKKCFRKADKYLPLSNYITYPLNNVIANTGEPFRIPNGRFFDPWKPKETSLSNSLRLSRIQQELQIAAERQQCYHLWWHPENYGLHPEENLSRLTALLKHYKWCKDQYGMQSWNMGEYALNLQSH